ncbi:esterase FE4-like isoform X3 [Pieris napi]|uniref:esterase FE4-like isoform X3 n=1 Tax=Pieris napi TaxID=78633 RepID=UPI001FBAC2F1|nr:esterase FE4-like isoform X3 [Pieris napi]
MIIKRLWILNFIFIPTVLVVWRKISDTNSRPVILTKNGLVRGLKSPNGDYDMFLGIPYGKVRQENPFGIADPYPKYEGIFDADDDNNPCPQYDEGFNFFAGTLDCLRLHIYTPKKSEKLAVMVYIHGGAFRYGHSGSCNGEKDYDPVYLIRHNIIFVSLTYRLGVYGYMCLGTKEIPGNTAMKDQLLALRWIKANIEAFGGDPDRITIFGHSSGSISVDFQVHYQHDNLFQQAILQSGTITNMHSFGEANTSLPFIMAENLGFKTRDLDAAIRFLSKQDPFNVIKAITNPALPILIFQPCIEKKFYGVEHFITKKPSELVPKVKNRKFLIGNTNDEYNIVIGNNPDEFFDDDHTIRKYLNYSFNFNEEELNGAVHKLKQFYIGNDEFSRKYRRQMTDLFSDMVHIYPTYKLLNSYHKNEATKVYYYLFTYSGGRNMYRQRNNLTLDTAIHADELGYLFQDLHVKSSSPEDQLMIDRMTTLWTNFAKYGDPVPSTSEILPTQWVPISDDSKAYFRIDKTTKMDTEFLAKNEFWEEFYRQYSKNYKY